MSYLPDPLQWTLAAFVLVAALFDIRERRIPNWLVLTGLAAGLSLQLVFFHGEGIKNAALGMAVAFAIYLPLFLLRAMGAGDVKLMAAVGAFAGPVNWVSIFLFTAISGGVIALILIALRGTMRRTLRNTWIVLAELGRFRAPHQANPELDVNNPRAVTLPHGVSIAVGTLLWLTVKHWTQ
jgi:prepilin peptidase CpaA